MEGSLKKQPIAVVCFDQPMHACACLLMVKNDGKHLKIVKSTSFRESLPIADQQLFFFVFLHGSHMSLLWAWWKRYFFSSFSNVFHHFRPCKCMRKYGRNTQQIAFFLYWWFVQEEFLTMMVNCGEKNKVNMICNIFQNLRILSSSSSYHLGFQLRIDSFDK